MVAEKRQRQDEEQINYFRARHGLKHKLSTGVKSKTKFLASRQYVLSYIQQLQTAWYTSSTSTLNTLDSSVFLRKGQKRGIPMAGFKTRLRRIPQD